MSKKNFKNLLRNTFFKKLQKTFKKGVDILRKGWYYKQVADVSDNRTLKTEQ
jgi:hypothetical protein